MGSPGKVVRQVSEEEVKSIKENANRYIRNWKNYQQNLKKL
jgi:carbonic anhydrase/acetyltransferase-like protein (isoleucine patch superfamily)